MRDVLVALLLSGLMGLLGQGVRAAVGLKSAATLSAGAPTQQSQFNAAYFGLSLMIGFIAGVLAGIGIGLDQIIKIAPASPGGAVDIKVLLGIAAAGYAGADFIENAFTRLMPGLGAAPAAPQGAGAGAGAAVPAGVGAVVEAEKEEADELPERIREEVFVRVHYGTDRALSATTEPNLYYGSERGDLKYGQAIVSIPNDHTMGYMERPSFWRVQLRESPESHIVLREIKELGHSQFFDELHSEVKHTKGSAAFVFIHGFNVTFAAAARRAAQMAYDLFLVGQQRGLATLSTIPILYSWPSKGGLLGAGDYFHDAADSEASGSGHLKEFLSDVVTLSGAATITIVAHSMGSRALTTALSHIGFGMPKTAKPLVKEIVLAAPDIDRDVFLNVVNAVTRTGERMTMYASNRDRALEASKAANGFPRLGDATGGVTVFAGGESIDASVVGDDILAHSYYGETSVLGDLYYLISQGTSPNQRFGLLAQGIPPNTHWVMRARK